MDHVGFMITLTFENESLQFTTLTEQKRKNIITRNSENLLKNSKVY